MCAPANYCAFKADWRPDAVDGLFSMENRNTICRSGCAFNKFVPRISSTVAMDHYYVSINDTEVVFNLTTSPVTTISSWHVAGDDEDVVKFNGTAQNPIHLNPFVMVWNFAACFVGIPLNLMIVVFMVSLRRLRRKSRNVFSLGLILSNLSAFVPVIIEFAYFHFPEENICLAYVAVVGLPCVLFMANALMSLCDRYAAMCRPLWHKRWVTVPFAVCTQVLGSFLVAVLYKSLYVFQAIPLRCEIKISQVKFVLFYIK